MAKVIVILPTYNEKGNIERLITTLQEDIFPKIKNHQMHILVADDESPDGTSDVVKELTKRWNNIYLNTGTKKGLGAAYLRSMDYAIQHLGADILFEMDADLSHDPTKIPLFLQKIDEGFDMVIGTRYSDGGSIPKNWGLNRKIQSIAGNLVTRLVLTRLSIHDWTGGYRALKKEVFLKEKSKLGKYKGYTFQVAFLHKTLQDDFKVAEIPFHFEDRALGKSKIVPAEYILDLLRYIFTQRFFEIWNSPLPKYAMVGFIGYFINAISLEIFARFFGLSSGLSASLGAELSIIWNFIMNNVWTFKEHKIESKKKLPFKFFQFNLVSFGSLLIIGTVVGVATKIFGNTGIVRQIALIFAIGFLVIPYSYSMYNIFIWKRWKIGFLSKIQDKLG